MNRMDNTTVLKDPVCGMTVTTHSFHHLEHLGQVHYFCSTSCKTRFASNALRYTHPTALQQATPTEVLSLHLLRGHARWVFLLSAAVVLTTLGIWLV
jgi:Cu+-exporting ATPase